MAALKARKLEQAAEKKRIRFIQMLETRYQVTGEGYVSKMIRDECLSAKANSPWSIFRNQTR